MCSYIRSGGFVGEKVMIKHEDKNWLFMQIHSVVGCIVSVQYTTCTDTPFNF